MRRAIPFLVVAATFSVGSVAVGHNTFFLPGDAFFFARIDTKTAKKLLDVESPTFSYGSPGNGGLGCGFIGYHKLQIKSMPLATRKALLDACKLFAKRAAKNPNNLDGKISFFIYSRDYDWKKHGLALQFNEKWADESVAFGVPRDYVLLGSFVGRPDLIIQNWRDSSVIAPLGAKCPVLPNGHKQAWVKSPVEIESKKCRILVIPDRKFGGYHQSSESGIELIEITDGKLSRYIREKSNWILKQ